MEASWKSNCTRLLMHAHVVKLNMWSVIWTLFIFYLPCNDMLTNDMIWKKISTSDIYRLERFVQNLFGCRKEHQIKWINMLTNDMIWNKIFTSDIYSLERFIQNLFGCRKEQTNKMNKLKPRIELWNIFMKTLIIYYFST